MPKCGFCLKTVPELHKKSHTQPKWMTKHAISPKGIRISKTENPKITQRSQWAEIICHDCEGLFSRYDTYAANLFGEDSKEFVEKNGIKAARYKAAEDVDVFFYHVTGINVKELQNFVFSVVIRQHLYLQKTKDPLLTEVEFNGLMKLMKEEHFNGIEYPIQVCNTDRDCVAIPPVRVSDDNSIRIMGSGIFVIVYMDSAKVGHIREVMLNEKENFFLERSSEQIGIMEDVKKMIAQMPQQARDYVNRKIDPKSK